MKKFLVLFLALFFITTLLNAQWVQTNGPISKTVHCINKSGSDIFIGTWGEGMYVSHNNAATWIRSNNGVYCNYISNIDLIGTNLFAATYGGGVYKSSNNGISWNAVNNGIQSLYVNAMLVSGNSIFIGTGQQIPPYPNYVSYLSTNNGASWAEINNGLPTNNPVNVFTAVGNRIIAGTNNGIYFTDDSGLHWTLANTGTLGFNVCIQNFLVSESTIYAAYNIGLLVSNDNGTTWAPHGSNIYNPVSVAKSGNILFVGSSSHRIYKSTDNGATWLDSSNGIIPYEITSLFVDGTNFFAGTGVDLCGGGGVYLSTDNGDNWVVKNNGFTPNEHVASLFTVDSKIIAGCSSGIFFSDNDGATWHGTDMSWADMTIYSFARIDTTVLAAGPIGILKSNLNCEKWVLSNTGFPYVGSPGNTYVDACAIAVCGNKVFVGGFFEGMYVSENNGNNWTEVTGFPVGNSVKSLAVSGTNIYAGCSSGVYVSTDYGINWSAVGVGLPTTGAIVELIVNGSNIFAGLDSEMGVYHYTDNGTSNIWTPANTGLVCYFINDFVAYGTDVFAATCGGIYKFSNNSNSWLGVNDNLAQQQVTSLTEKNNILYAGMCAGMCIEASDSGVWKRPLSEITADENIVVERNSVKLSPNPAKGFINVMFENEEKQNILIQIYNVKNELLYSEVLTDFKGQYEKTINCIQYASGTYLLKITSGNIIQTQKFIINK